MKNSDSYKLDRSRLEKLLNLYNRVQRDRNTLDLEFQKAPIDKIQEHIPPPSRWSIFYELEYPQHLMFVMKWLGIFEEYAKAAKSDTPVKNLLDYFDKFDENSIAPPEAPRDGITEYHAILSIISLVKTLKSWMVFGKTLSKLHDEAGEGSFSALYKGLQIDPAFITTTNGSYLFSIALLKRKKSIVVNTIHNKMRSNLKKHNPSLEPVRFILTALAEVGDYNKYTESDRHRLFVKDLGIYKSMSKDSAKKDDFDSLNEFVRKWRRTAEFYPV